MRLPVPLAFLLAAAFAAGCERPFVDVQQPAIAVESPDLGAVQTPGRVLLRVDASSFRDVAAVTVNGEALTRVGGGILWEGNVVLETGLTPLVLRATDAGGVARVDTAYALARR